MAGGWIAVRLVGSAFNFGFVFGFALGFCCGFAEMVWADRQTNRLCRQTGRQADRGTDGHKGGRWSEGLRTDDGQNDNERQDGQGFMTRRSARSLNTQSASFHRYC